MGFTSSCGAELVRRGDTPSPSVEAAAGSNAGEDVVRMGDVSLGLRRGGMRSSGGASLGEGPATGERGGERPMETLSNEAGEMSFGVGVCGRLLGVEDPKGRSVGVAAGGKLKEPALRGERSAMEPSDVERDKACGFILAADSGCAFHK
mmetsp:Transcript_16785/g.42691  ORF Transcript_16785/g.42691 Transcript_16785/m.42691 type:complete len:149 (-) Transcript_16785:865-1311(-)